MCQNCESKTMNKTIGFIGGGRVTRIMLRGFRQAGLKLGKTIVSDSNPEVLKKISDEFPDVTVVQDGNKQAIKSDIAFIALHPPVMASTLEELKADILPGTVIVSLAPKFTIAKISELCGGSSKVARMIPNAPSIVGQGFNPIAVSDAIAEDDKKVLDDLFLALGEYKVVPEKNLETYSVLTAMGPTYLWFQLYELQEIAKGFGLSDEEAKEGVRNMVAGALATMYDSGISSDIVMDLVPVKPLGEQEELIKSFYREKLNMIYQRIKP